MMRVRMSFLCLMMRWVGMLREFAKVFDIVQDLDH
jgi:hypothetical protein